MFINLSELYSKGFYDVDFVYSFPLESLKGTDLLSLDDIKIKGNIKQNSINEYILNVVVEGTMVLPCSISLKPVDYDFSVNVTENLDELIYKSAKKSENRTKSIDILPIIWENILMEIPMKVVSGDISDVKIKGDGWELITEEDRTNTSLSQLKDLL